MSFKMSSGNYTYGYLAQIQEGGGSRASELLLLKIYPVGSGTNMQPTTYGFKSTFYVNGQRYKADDEGNMSEVADLLRKCGNTYLEAGEVDGEEVT